MKSTSFLQALFLLLFIPLNLRGQDNLSKGDHFAPVNGIKIHYYVSGSGPVCLVPSPGWGPSIDYLRNSLTPLERFFTIVYYDTRISGQSTGPDNPSKYSSMMFIKDMEALRKYLKLSKVWLLGHSSGGFQVLYYAIQHNDKLNGIIALSAFAGLDEVREREYQAMILKRKDLPGHERGYSILSGIDKTQYPAGERLQYTLPFYFHDISKMSDFKKISTSPVSVKAGEYTSASGLGLENLLPYLHRISVPALIVVGDDDFMCDKVSQSDRIAAGIKGSTELVIKNAGHFSWIEQPDQFYSGCFGWLRNEGLKEYEKK